MKRKERKCWTDHVLLHKNTISTDTTATAVPILELSTGEEDEGGSGSGSGWGGKGNGRRGAKLVTDSRQLQPNCRILFRWGGNVGDVEGLVLSRSRTTDWWRVAWISQDGECVEPTTSTKH